MSARCAALFLCLAIAGCASMIKPQKIDPAIYVGYSCEQIRDEQKTLTAALGYAAGQQRTSVLLAVTGGPAGAMAGGWHGSQIANLKGRLIALASASSSKGCAP